MKKLSFVFKTVCLSLMILLGIGAFTGCGQHEIDINNLLIEYRQTLYVAEDSIYQATLSTGMREQEYNFDGIVGEMIPFAVLTIARMDNNPLANDQYKYLVTIGDDHYTGFLSKTTNENSYSVDIQVAIPTDAVVDVQITFTGYSFHKELSNVSKEFAIDSMTAITIANQELQSDLQNLSSDKNNKLEAIIKLLKDHSNSEIKSYYYYIGVLSTSGETLGILIDANTGNIIAKKI